MTHSYNDICEGTHDWNIREYSRPLTLVCGRCSGKRIVQEGEMLPEEVWEEYEELKEWHKLKERGYVK